MTGIPGSGPIIVPTLETERLTLRQLTEDDIPFIFDIFSREETSMHDLYDPVRSIEEARDLYEKFIRPRPALFRLGMFLRTTSQPIGTIGFYAIDTEHRRAILGYDLLSEFWGNGYATEAVVALLDHAFSEMRLNRIHASADTDNLRSLAVLERVGFTREGVMRKKDFYRGAFHDDAVYSMLREEWPSRRPDGRSRG